MTVLAMGEFYNVAYTEFAYSSEDIRGRKAEAVAP